MNPELVFGLKDDKLMHISEVESGLNCNCVCAACRRRLIAKKGDIKVYHFAHEDGSDCQAALESALHIAAKEILEKEKRIRLPEYKLGDWVAFANYMLEFDKIKLERHYGDIIPDILIFKRERPLIIEIKVTHPVDEVKLQKIRELGMSAIEVDLLNTNCPDINYDGFIKDYVIDSVLNKKWLYNARESEYRAQIEKRKKQCRLPSWSHFEGVPMINVWHCPLTKHSAICDDCEHRIDWEQRAFTSPEDDYNSPKFVPNYVYCGKLLRN